MTTAWVFKCRIVAICFVWYICSSVQSIVNKMILQHYNYPITVAIANQVLIPVMAIPFLKAWKVKEARLTTSQYRRYLLPIAVGRAIASSSAAFSLSLMPVSYQQTVKALMPIFAVVMGRCILHERQTTLVYLSLLPIVLGVLVATVTEISFSLTGLIAALVSTATYSLLNILVKKLLKQADIHPVRLLAMTSQACAVVLFPVWLVRDAAPMAGDLMNPSLSPSSSSSSPDLHLLFLLLCSSICSFGQNVCAFSLIHMLTALSYAVTNATKRITVIVASLLTLHNPVSGANLAGMMLAVCGVFCYSQAKQYQKEHVVDKSSGKEDSSSFLSGRDRSLQLPMTRSHTTLSDATLVAMDTGDSADVMYWATKKSNGVGGGSRLATVISSSASNRSSAFVLGSADGLSVRNTRNGSPAGEHNRERKSVRFVS
ncbi:hypothetical protein PFISCL1PPCAC_8257 [Pristionchus fissidentatus]|uniref:Sugar phosphate transporter domain-containing protein n=1 Tax=Pristionchus fissidentatus TaxID=1538716 RepID=A0AAV5VEE7_9BILA|nr:hypothetical protein PFISCL1PPCAC_8257 [Pristionchus fissidentatus]